MMFFENLKKYANGYEVVNSRNFTAEEIAAIQSAQVVNSEFGQSVCFCLISGGKVYIPVSRDSVVETGSPVDMNTAVLLTLEKDGDIIDRVEII